MILYAIIMFLTAIPFGILSAKISKGNIQLIHDYHRTKVTDPAAYGKAFGKAMWVMTAAMAVSGVVSLLGDSDVLAGIAVGVLLVGLSAGIIQIIQVQKTYNGGVF